MTITIVHLYYDLLNLYGDNGNIKAIKNYLEKLNIKVNIKFISIDDKIDLKNCNLVYIGSGTENNQLLALKHLLKYKSNIKEYINNNGYFIATGNSIELFGKYIQTDKKIKCLDIFDFITKDEGFRIVDEALCKNELINDYILGFRNSKRVMKDINENSLFYVVKGTGSYPKCSTEGIKVKNFYGTYLIGPLLVRNPKLLTYICNNLIKSINSKFKIKKVNLKLETMAHQKFIKNYYSKCID